MEKVITSKDLGLSAKIGKIKIRSISQDNCLSYKGRLLSSSVLPIAISKSSIDNGDLVYRYNRVDLNIKAIINEYKLLGYLLLHIDDNGITFVNSDDKRVFVDIGKSWGIGIEYSVAGRYSLLFSNKTSVLRIIPSFNSSDIIDEEEINVDMGISDSIDIDFSKIIPDAMFINISKITGSKYYSLSNSKSKFKADEVLHIEHEPISDEVKRMMSSFRNTDFKFVTENSGVVYFKNFKTGIIKEIYRPNPISMTIYFNVFYKESTKYTKKTHRINILPEYPILDIENSPLFNKVELPEIKEHVVNVNKNSIERISNEYANLIDSRYRFKISINEFTDDPDILSVKVYYNDNEVILHSNDYMPIEFKYGVKNINIKYMLSYDDVNYTDMADLNIRTPDTDNIVINDSDNTMFISDDYNDIDLNIVRQLDKMNELNSKWTLIPIYNYNSISKYNVASINNIQLKTYTTGYNIVYVDKNDNIKILSKDTGVLPVNGVKYLYVLKLGKFKYSNLFSLFIDGDRTTLSYSKLNKDDEKNEESYHNYLISNNPK